VSSPRLPHITPRNFGSAERHVTNGAVDLPGCEKHATPYTVKWPERIGDEEKFHLSATVLTEGADALSGGIPSPRSRVSTASDVHTWIQPVVSRPTTQDGKEILMSASRRREAFDLQEDDPDASSERSQPETPIPVQGIGAVSVRLVAGQDECVVDYEGGHGLSQNLQIGTQSVEMKGAQLHAGQSLSGDSFHKNSKEEHIGKEILLASELLRRQQELQELEEKKMLDDERQYMHFRETSAYYVQTPEASTPGEMPTGGGFSKHLMRLANPRSRMFQYPTPSEALSIMAKRPHARFHAPTSGVAMVGMKPPVIDQTYYTLKQMKRQWLMQYSKDIDVNEPTRPHKEPVEKRARVREDEKGDTMNMCVPFDAGRKTSRPSTNELASRPSTGASARYVDSLYRETSSASPWLTSPIPGEQRSPLQTQSQGQRAQLSATLPATKTSHGYTPPRTMYTPMESDEMLDLFCRTRGIEKSEDLRSALGFMNSSQALPDVLDSPASVRERKLDGLSPIGEISFESAETPLSEAARSPHLRIGLSQEVGALIPFSDQAPLTPSKSPRQPISSAHRSMGDAIDGEGELREEGNLHETNSPTDYRMLDSPSRGSPWSSQAHKPSSYLPALVHGDMKVVGSGKPIAEIRSPRAIIQQAGTVKVGRSTGHRPEQPHSQLVKNQTTDVTSQDTADVEHTFLDIGHHAETLPIKPAGRSLKSAQILKHERHRVLMQEELQRKHLISEGNRARLRCEDELEKGHLQKAIASHARAYGIFSRANALHEKLHLLDDLSERIVQMTSEYHDHVQQEHDDHLTLHKTIKRESHHAIVRVPLQGPDRLQPDGMLVKTREELEELRRQILEEERRRRARLIEEAKLSAEMARRLKELEEKEKQIREREELRLEEERLRLEKERLHAASKLQAFARYAKQKQDEKRRQEELKRLAESAVQQVEDTLLNNLVEEHSTVVVEECVKKHVKQRQREEEDKQKQDESERLLLMGLGLFVERLIDVVEEKSLLDEIKENFILEMQQDIILQIILEVPGGALQEALQEEKARRDLEKARREEEEEIILALQEGMILEVILEAQEEVRQEIRAVQIPAVVTLQGCVRRSTCNLKYKLLLEDLFAEEARIRREHEALQKSIEVSTQILQAAIRAHPDRADYLRTRLTVMMLSAFCLRNVFQAQYAKKPIATIILKAAVRRIAPNALYAASLTGIGTLQGAVRRSPVFEDHRARRQSICFLQSRVRMYLEMTSGVARREAKVIIAAFVRQQTARHDYSKYVSNSLILQALFRRSHVRPSFGQMRFGVSLLQTVCRRALDMEALEAKFAFSVLEPLLQRGVANHKWHRYLSSAAKLLCAVETTALSSKLKQQLSAADVLIRIVRRNKDVASYHAELLEIWRLQEEERKRLEEEEKARKRAEEVARKQKEIMEQMEAKQRALKEAADKAAAEDANRKKILASYSKVSLEDKQDDKIEEAPKRVLHAGQHDKEKFAIAVAYEREELYPDAINILSSIIRVPALRMACLLKRATCMGKLGLRKDCLKDLDTAVKEFPDEHLPYYMRALHHVQWQHDELAMQDIRSGLIVQSDHAESLNLQASLAFKNGFYVDAITVSTRALSIKHDMPQLYIIRGMSRERIGIMKEAADDLELAIDKVLEGLPRNERDPSAVEKSFHLLSDNFFMVYCDACLADKEAGAHRVIDKLSSVIRCTAKRGVLFALRARALCTLQKFEEAQENFEQAGSVEKENSCVHLLQAQFKRSTDPKAAIGDCFRATEIDPQNCRAHVVRGKIHEEQQSSRDAFEAYKQAMVCGGLTLLHYESGFRAAVLQFKLADNSVAQRQEAFALFREVARVHAPMAEPLIRLSQLLEATGGHREAVKHLTRVIHQNPTDPCNYVLRSKCLLHLGQKAAALRDWQAALHLDTRDDPSVLENKINDLLISKQFSHALSKIQEAIANDPSNVRFRLLLARLHQSLEHDDEAESAFNQAVEVGADDANAYHGRGEFRLKKGEVSEAVDDFTKAIEIDGSLVGSLVGRCEGLILMERTAPAWRDLDAIFRVEHKNKRALLLRAMVQEKEGKIERALKDYAAIISVVRTPKEIRTMPDLLAQDTDEKERIYYLFEAHMKSGLLCTKLRDFAGAIEHYNHVIQMKPSCFKALLHRGIAFHSHGYYDSAMSDYNRALTVEPGNALVLQNRAKAYVSQKKWRRAQADLELIKHDQRSAEVWSLLATCFSAIDENEAALKAINASLHLDGISLQALVQSLLPCFLARSHYFSDVIFCHMQ
jgi:tetratricopeptide (TPR) repeat protein